MESSARIICVDDGVGDVRVNDDPRMLVVPGDKPFIFSRNVNIGIAAAGSDDVVILNDDAILKSMYGFSIMQREGELHPDFGVIAATTNNVGNRNQYRISDSGLREDPRMVCFVAVFVPRTTIEKVGFLDEEFTGYGYDDDSYCLRVRRAGLRIGICDGCYVDHASLPSTFRSQGYPVEGFHHNAKVFEEKYGVTHDLL
jgi:GT2 family glycosyltransferase